MRLKSPVVRRRIVRALFITLLISLIAAILVGTALANVAVPKGGHKGKSKKPSEKPPDPECGMNPYLWNYVGSHYQRRFSMYCYAVNGDPNELKYDEKWCNETPLIWTGVCTVPPPA